MAVAAHHLARLIDKLTEKGAAVIAFDVVFAEPDRSSISRMVRDLVACTDPETVQKLAAAVQDNDQVLADAMAQLRASSWASASTSRAVRRRPGVYGMAFAGDNPVQCPAGAAGGREGHSAPGGGG